MSITFEWYDAQQTIIVSHVSAEWSWSGAEQARATVRQFAQSVTHSVSLIVVLPPDISVPPHGFAENFKAALENHATLGIKTVIYVTHNPATQALWESAINMYASPTVQYGFAHDLEAALAMLL